MKKAAMKILAVSVLAASMTAAFADTAVDRTGSYYFSPALGIYMPDHNRDMNNNLVGSLTFGYNFTDQLAVQAMFNGASLSSSNSSGNDTSAYLLNVDGIVNIPTGTRFVPYLAAGVGLDKVDQTSFAIDSGVGANYFLGPDFSLTANYRHVNDFNDELSDDLLTFGVTWSFGGNQNVVVSQAPLTTKQQAMLAEAKNTLRDVLPEGVVLCGNGVTAEQGCVTMNGDQMVMHLDVKFANDKASISSKYPAAIDRLATFMSKYPSTSVVLYGYASKVGTEAYNQKLSLRRADNVQSYLIGKGVDSSRIQTVGMGTKDPLASNATKAGRAQNRRVQADVPVPLSSNAAATSTTVSS